MKHTRERQMWLPENYDKEAVNGKNWRQTIEDKLHNLNKNKSLELT